MASLESLFARIQAAKDALTAVALEIRDIPLEPRKENLQVIADTFVNLSEIEGQIYALRPELIPTYLWAATAEPIASLVVEGAFLRVADAEKGGDHKMAIDLLEFLLRTQPAGSHVDKVNGELARLRALIAQS